MGNVRDSAVCTVSLSVRRRVFLYYQMCIIPFIKRAERGRHTPHNYESTPVDPLRQVGIVSSTEAPKLNNYGALSAKDCGREESAGGGWTKGVGT